MRKKYFVAASIFLMALWGCKTHYPLADQRFTLIEKPGSLSRGRNLAYNVCGQCHYDIASHTFAGQRMFDLPGIMGRVYSANLTNTWVKGVLPHYTDAEIYYLLKTGINRNGRFIPYMVRPTMADDDINDLIVFFRSEDEAVKGNDTSVGRTRLSIIGKLAVHMAKPTDLVEGIQLPDKRDNIATGRYLIDQLGCFHCHSRSIKTLNYTHAEQSKGYMQGGMEFKDRQCKKVFASNLTPDLKTGIGRYTDSDFAKVLHSGITPTGEKVRFPMRQFPAITNAQCAAIFTYLHSLPAKKHKVKGH